ncbi:unnamed protein product, partial [Gongylonema pulchrum]|uniref:DUF4808 domain-containing protein n=1 Tax=Gongylonema pulchrum TaxID=637853 RepID=A0A183EEB6_9BILA
MSMFAQKSKKDVKKNGSQTKESIDQKAENATASGQTIKYWNFSFKFLPVFYRIYNFVTLFIALFVMLVRRRGPPIMIDDEESAEEEEAEFKPVMPEKSTSAKNRAETTSSQKTKKKGKSSNGKAAQQEPLFMTQNDLFTDGASSPEKMDTDEADDTIETEEEQKYEEMPKKKRPSACIMNRAKTDEAENGDTQNTKEKPTRMERVTETFLDSDGFM